MIEYIIYPNERIDQQLLFESIRWYNTHRNMPIYLRIVGADVRGELITNSYDLTIYFEIRTNNFKCKAYEYKDGKVNKAQTTIVNASDETIMVKYKLYGKEDYKFGIERNDPVFNLVNYALQYHDRVLRGNRQGLKNVSSLTLENVLKGLDFKAVVEKDENGQLILRALPKDATKVNYSER